MIEEKDVEEIYSYICEYAKMTYEYELRRYDSIMQQASNMQTAFSFITAVLFMVAPLLLDNCSYLPGWFYFVVFSVIAIIMFVSLFAATMAQNRRRAKAFEDAALFRAKVENEYQSFITQAQRQQYLAKYYEKIQKDLFRRNEDAIEWLQLSMHLFYAALISICLSYVIGLFIIGLQ